MCIRDSSYTDGHGSGKTASAVSDAAVANSDCEPGDVLCATLTAAANSFGGTGWFKDDAGTLTDPLSGDAVTGFTYNSQDYALSHIDTNNVPRLRFGLDISAGADKTGLASLTLVVGGLKRDFADDAGPSASEAFWTIGSQGQLTVGSVYTVRVFDAQAEDQAGTVTLAPADPEVGTEVTATLTDPDGGVTGTTWQWASSSDWDGSTGTWTDISLSLIHI